MRKAPKVALPVHGALDHEHGWPKAVGPLRRGATRKADVGRIRRGLLRSTQIRLSPSARRHLDFPKKGWCFGKVSLHLRYIGIQHHANAARRSRSQLCAGWVVVRSCQILAMTKPGMVSGGSSTCTRSDQPSAIRRGINAIMSDRDTISGTIRKPDVDRATVRRRPTASSAASAGPAEPAALRRDTTTCSKAQNTSRLRSALHGLDDPCRAITA